MSITLTLNNNKIKTHYLPLQDIENVNIVYKSYHHLQIIKYETLKQNHHTYMMEYLSYISRLLVQILQYLKVFTDQFKHDASSKRDQQFIFCCIVFMYCWIYLTQFVYCWIYLTQFMYCWIYLTQFVCLRIVYI